MYLSENIKEKWDGVMNHPDLPEIKDPHRRDVTRVLLENQEQYLAEAVPTSNIGNWARPGATGTGSGEVNTWDPILISLVRRAMPQMIAYDVCGVQPMTGPTGLIFAMRANYDTQGGAEALFHEADSDHSGDGGSSHVTTDNTNNPFDGTWTAGNPATTAQGEAMGDGSQHLGAMAFTIDKTMVQAKTRALKAEYSTELAQDLKAVHGLDAETELANILSTEILTEINREIIRTIYFTAQWGAPVGEVTTANTFDLNTDSNGRWMVEKFKGLLYQVEREANRVSVRTRRGKGNFIITTNDVASALAMAGVLDYAPAMEASVNNDTHVSTMVGTVNGMKVYVDPYYAGGHAGTTLNIDHHMLCVGYKGTSPYDAGMFYCPYVPLQMVRAMSETTFQPKIAFKTRYGLVNNPYTAAVTTAGSATAGNSYYSKIQVTNLM